MHVILKGKNYGNFSGLYWASFEWDASNACIDDFSVDDGSGQFMADKSFVAKICAVRAF